MKLLLDENLSRRIVPFLQDAFPGSSHVVMEGLERTDDNTVWSYARENGFVIVSKDSDFHEMSLVLGSPPQVIWLRAGNTGKAQLIQLLTENSAQGRERRTSMRLTNEQISDVLARVMGSRVTGHGVGSHGAHSHHHKQVPVSISRGYLGDRPCSRHSARPWRRTRRQYRVAAILAA